MTWLASSWMLKVTPSSDEKDFRGDSVPDVRTMVRTLLLISEKAYKETWNKRGHLLKKPNSHLIVVSSQDEFALRAECAYHSWI